MALERLEQARDRYEIVIRSLRDEIAKLNAKLDAAGVLIEARGREIVKLKRALDEAEQKVELYEESLDSERNR